ncbi:hypothetical protein [Actinacidiphila sp. bgisy160]|uniref:hypothetical protein n=1 Tax=Actinacidiphila sp. bgisy160 TaxID=3413796 RepID=UPI003D720809
MPTLRFRRTAIAATAAALLPFTLTACGDDGKDNASDASSTMAPSDPADDSSPSQDPADAMSVDNPFGAACSAVPKDGAGSFDGMAKDPVATAASNNPVCPRSWRR